MLGILFILLISYLLLYLLDKKNLGGLGFYPSQIRIYQAFMGMMLAVLFCIIAQSIKSILSEANWALNNRINFEIIAKAAWWDFKSVLTEELIFRGVILYFLIKKIGSSKAVMLSAAAFGIYHWFSYGIFGNIIPMIFIFIGTGLMGYALALSFAKGKSILLPIALHFGWNFTQNTIFSHGPLGDLILLQSGGHTLEGYISLVDFAFSMIIPPIVIIIAVRRFVKA